MSASQIVHEPRLGSAVENSSYALEVLSSTLNHPQQSALESIQKDAVEQVGKHLRQFVSGADFIDHMNSVFGSAWNRQAMQSLVQQWQQSDFKNLATIDILTGLERGNTKAARVNASKLGDKLCLVGR